MKNPSHLTCPSPELDDGVTNDTRGRAATLGKAACEVLIYAPYPDGGIGEHTFYQAKALQKRGASVLCLATPAFLEGREVNFPVMRVLTDFPPRSTPALRRRLKHLWCLVVNPARLAWEIIRRRPTLVLYDSYAQYMAPVWIWPHWVLSQFFGVKYAANLHDPFRRFHRGPVWWHRLSVWLAYRPLDFVLVHDKLPEPSPVPAGVRVVEVPVGVYEVRAKAPVDREAIRKTWGVRASQKVFLAFGQVRDNKNLDMSIRALANLPQAFLVIAGTVASDRDRPFSFYRDLANQLHVTRQCYFHEGFVTDGEVGVFFEGADFVVLTYWSKFQSQSGVLNIAARCRKQVLASAGPSPLMDAVRRFRLGVALPPDSARAVEGGIRELLENPPVSQWEEYESHASWDANADGILLAAGLQTKEVRSPG